MLTVYRGSTHCNNHGKACGKAPNGKAPIGKNRGKSQTRAKSRGKAQREQGTKWASGRC